MGVATILFVLAGIVATSRFVHVFHELGVALPLVTQWALTPLVHVVIGVLLLGVCAGALRSEWRSWAIGAWIFLLLIYAAGATVGLFAPIIGLIEALDQQAGK